MLKNGTGRVVAAGAAEVPVERQARGRRRGMRGRERRAERRIGPEAALVGVPSRSISAWSMAGLVGGIHAGERGGDLAVDAGDGAEHALPAVP